MRVDDALRVEVLALVEVELLELLRVLELEPLRVLDDELLLELRVELVVAAGLVSVFCGVEALLLTLRVFVALLRSELLLRVDDSPVLLSVVVVVLVRRVDVEEGVSVVVVDVTCVRVGLSTVLVVVVVLVAPSVWVVVVLIRVVLPEVRVLVVVTELPVRLVVVTVLLRVLVLEFESLRVDVELALRVDVVLAFRVDVEPELRVDASLLRVADVPAVRVLWLRVELADVLLCVEALRVLLMLRVPDSWLALAARVPLYIVVARDAKASEGYWRP